MSAELPFKPLRAHLFGSCEGALDGTQVNLRELAQIAYDTGPRWRDAKTLALAVAVALAESQGFDRAHCDNFQDEEDGTRTLLSRDIGIWEINIPASLVGTKREEHLYEPKANAKAAYELFERRGWQPWVSFNRGIVFHDPYLQRAVLGVMNFLAEDLIEVAKDRKAYQKTTVPIFRAEQLPYLKGAR